MKVLGGVKHLLKLAIKRVNKIKEENLNDYLISVEKEQAAFTTYWNRPKYSEDICAFSQSYSNPSIAIILQGPILRQNDFTLETVKLYHRYYPACPIVVSTWDDEPETIIKEITEIGSNVFVVQSKKPENRGWGNINYQRRSSCAGINFAESLGCEYTLKSRTDQRIYSSNSMLFFKSLIDMFPLKVKTSARGRIAVCGLSTIKNRLYNICDMLLFGYTEDIKRYFSPPETDKMPEDNPPDEFLHPVEYAMFRPGEIFFASHYIESLGYRLRWTFEDSDYFRNELFVVFDAENIDLFWPKYNRKEYRWRSYSADKYDIVTYKDWFIAYALKHSQ